MVKSVGHIQSSLAVISMSISVSVGPLRRPTAIDDEPGVVVRIDIDQ
jgi:hypothetical protein